MGRPFVHTKRANDSCSTGGFYKSPTASQSFTYTTPINIAWDPSCLTANYADIYLYAFGASTSRIHAWHNVYAASGSYQTIFQPKWWNSTNSANLQLSIVPANTPPFLAPYPAGPIFTVTYQTPSSGGPPASADTSKPDGAVSVVNNGPYINNHTSGKVAAAVIVPLLFIIFLVGGAFVRLRRQSGREERRRWSEAVDKRMSTISTDWKPISAAGAQAAIRNSIAFDANNRASSFSFGNIRPASTIAEGGQAGIGSKARTVLPGQSNGTAQLRSSLATSQIMAERVSRVSFAPDVRPSSETRRTVTSRAFHTSIIPPLPDRKWDASQTPTLNSDNDESLSPTQTNGPETLSIEDIQAHLAGKETKPLPSVDAVMPALRMMRRDASPEAGEEEPELLFSAQSTTFPAIPSPTHSPRSPESASAMSSFMPMQAMPANVMSPDDMLRVYAERRAAGGAGMLNGPTIPSPTYAGIGAQGGMRTLYPPPLPQTEGGVVDSNKKRITLESQYSGFADEDAYGGTD
jgi:hypothetical protein